MVDSSEVNRLKAENVHLRQRLAILQGEQAPTYTMHLSTPPKVRGTPVTLSNAASIGYTINVSPTPKGLRLFNNNDSSLTISDLWIIGSAPTTYDNLIRLEFTAQTIRTRLKKLETMGAIKITFDSPQR